jgi:hypothetical protein
VDAVLSGASTNLQFLEANWLETTLFVNQGDRFEAHLLPPEAQFAPSFGLSVGDCDGDGNEDLFLSQNFFSVNEETSRYDAGRGLWLRGDGRGGFRTLSGQESGVVLHGEQRGSALCDFDADGRVDLAVAQNNGPHGLFHNRRAKPGLRVRLEGPPGNPDGIGAIIRLVYGASTGMGPARVIAAGSGYWSQEGRVQVLGRAENPTGVWVRWPDGKVSIRPVTAGAQEVLISADNAARSN